MNPVFSCWRTAFNAGRLVARYRTTDGETVKKASLVRKAIGARGPNSENLSRGGNLAPPHRRDLPPPPKTHKDLMGHPYEQEFREAEKVHLKSHEELRTWRVVSKDNANQRQVLDCMWVSVYKFDKHGRLQKCKARLVVRDDQQARNAQNTYASTLAARSFRTLMAIAARFDLELFQYDVVNAFVNADLNQEVYMKMPLGYRKPGMILLLRKALYGLREAPLLWQQHFIRTLTNMGFRTIPHEPCCMIGNGILIFYYVDDIVFAFHKDKTAEGKGVGDLLGLSYNLSGGGNLQWFLRIEVIRGRSRRLIWLSQASYIDKIAQLVAESSGSNPRTPMRNKELLPYDGHATLRLINQHHAEADQAIAYIHIFNFIKYGCGCRVDYHQPASQAERLFC